MKNKDFRIFKKLSLFFLLPVPFHFCHHVGKPNVAFPFWCVACWVESLKIILQYAYNTVLLKQEFYKYKFIYVKSDAKHSNKDYIGNAWADIAKELNCNGKY